MKYVILIGEDAIGVSRIYPYIFSERDTHSEVAKYMIHMQGMETGVVPEVLSSGFCGFSNGQIDVVSHGSESLKIRKSLAQAKRDHELLNMPDALQGIVL